MARGSIKLWFCLVAAVAAVAIADPLLEAASNAGWFGPGNFTDHSNVDIGPVFALGLLFAGFYLASRIHRMRARIVTGSGVWRLLPVIFGAQIATLYLAESCEQCFVHGHLLAPAVWLGAPIAVSLAAHAASCVFTTLALSRLLEILYGKTLELVRLVRVFATARMPVTGAFMALAANDAAPHLSLCALCRLGERAPPFVAA